MRFDEYVASEMGHLSRFAGALTGDKANAEDVLADALFTVFKHWRRIERMDHPDAYVRRVVVNTFLDERRRQARRNTWPTSDTRVLDHKAMPQTDRAESRLLIDQLLPLLTKQQRAAVVLRYVDDLDDQAIAHAMGCTPSTVRAHLSNARTTLRMNLAGEEQ